MIPESLKKYAFFRLPEPVVLMAVSILIMAAIMAYMQSYTWASRQDYSFGYIMPLFAAYILYDRWGRIRGYFGRPPSADFKNPGFSAAVSAGFGMLLAGGLASYLLGAFYFGLTKNFAAPVFVISFGFSFTFYSLAFFAGSRNSAGERMGVRDRFAFASLFVFPAFGWLVSAPLFSAWETEISLFLLSKVAFVVYEIMDVLGYVITLQNNVISFPNGQVGVADACSGIRSLTACLFAGSFLAAVFLNKFWKKALMVAFSMFLAFFNNLLRALFLSFWAYHYGPESISGAVHDYAGYVVMLMTVVELLMLMPLFQLSAVPKEFQGESGR